MNKKSLIKYEHDQEKGLMHYVVYNGEVVILSRYESKKVTYIEKNGTLDISFDIDSKALDTVKAEVITNQEYVMKVYNFMIETSNAYFFEGTEGVCVIRIGKEHN